MKLKEKIKAIPSYFSYRQKVTLVSILGVIAGLCILFAYLLRMHTYIIGDDPPDFVTFFKKEKC